MKAFKAQEASNLLWAFATMGEAPGEELLHALERCTPPKYRNTDTCTGKWRQEPGATDVWVALMPSIIIIIIIINLMPTMIMIIIINLMPTVSNLVSMPLTRIEARAEKRRWHAGVCWRRCMSSTLQTSQACCGHLPPWDSALQSACWLRCGYAQLTRYRLPDAANRQLHGMHPPSKLFAH